MRTLAYAAILLPGIIGPARHGNLRPRFDHSGHNKTICWNDGSEHKVNRIEALVTPVPYGMYAGWPKK